MSCRRTGSGSSTSSISTSGPVRLCTSTWSSEDSRRTLAALTGDTEKSHAGLANAHSRSGPVIVMEIPEAFYEFCLLLHQDSYELYGPETEDLAAGLFVTCRKRKSLNSKRSSIIY